MTDQKIIACNGRDEMTSEISGVIEKNTNIDNIETSHPLIYLKINKASYVSCPYCARKFHYK